MSYFSLFQSPHPVRGATGSRSCWPPSQCHFNPRTPRGVRLAPHAGGGAAILISIHAPREGCDTINQLRMAFQIQFQSTHPARGATSNDKRLEADELLFQSTHPARGATVCRRATMDVFTCFNPRTPRGVRPRRSAKPSWPLPFQSTHPARGATYYKYSKGGHKHVSIHAPREGCDPKPLRCLPIQCNFNPRTPRGVRRTSSCILLIKFLFQSTHPARGATALVLLLGQGLLIFQSTHPARGATSGILPTSIPSSHFNPRTPRGVRQRYGYDVQAMTQFQSTHPARGATYGA